MRTHHVIELSVEDFLRALGERVGPDRRPKFLAVRNDKGELVTLAVRDLQKPVADWLDLSGAMPLSTAPEGHDRTPR